jgi:alkyldihydroxyacetonephosphate synthase
VNTNRGAPTPPIGLEGDVRHRFDSGRVEVDDKVLTRLRDACASVEVGGVEHGRDWWPLTLTWAVEGEVPALPAAVARPASAGEVADVLAVCNDAGVPVTPSAGRSGVCGGSLPVFGGVTLDLVGMAGIIDVDDSSLLVRVRPGTFGDVFEDTLRDEHGLTLGHWPQSMALSTVGGWLACRSAGQYSTRYGKIEDMVVGLEVATADGRRIPTGGVAPRAAMGPDLNQLFVGSEGTLGVITEATLRAHPVPPAEGRAAYSFQSFAEGLDACRRILRRGAMPAVLRLYDSRESKRSFDVESGNVMIVLDEAEPAIVDATMTITGEECAGAAVLDEGLVGGWLEHRNDVSQLESVVRNGIVVDTFEMAGRWSVLPKIYDEAIAAVRAVPGTLAATAHQSHAYADGACLYFTFAGRRDGNFAEWGDDYYRAGWDAITEVVEGNGAAISHHHGIGLNRGRDLRNALGPAFDVLVSMKQALDPKGILNPGKLGLPSPFGAAPW